MRGVCYGNLMQQGTHVIDMLRWFAGDARVAWVMAQADDWDGPEKDRGHPAPMWTAGYFAFENGLRATLEAGPRSVPARGAKPRRLHKSVRARAEAGGEGPGGGSTAAGGGGKRAVGGTAGGAGGRARGAGGAADSIMG